jgi:hypothetical protein
MCYDCLLQNLHLFTILDILPYNSTSVVDTALFYTTGTLQLSTQVQNSDYTNSVALEPERSSPHSQQPATGPLSWANWIHSTPRQPIDPMIHSDLILLSTSRSSEWSLSFGHSHQILIHFSPLSHPCHMPRPPHPLWHDLPDDTRGWVKIMKLLIVHFVQLVQNSYIYIVTSSQVLFHDGTLLHSKLNTQLLITVHNSSRIPTQVQLLPVL